jgi:ribose transport system permease protein
MDDAHFPVPPPAGSATTSDGFRQAVSVAALGPGTPGRRRFGHKQGVLALRFGTLLACLLVLVYFAIEKPGSYATWSNVEGVLTLAAPLMLMAMVLTFPLRVGDFDLSVAYQAQFYSALVVVLMTRDTLSTGIGLVITLVAALLVGTVLGLVVAHSRVSAFVVTLAAGSVLLGLEIEITGNAQISDHIPISFTEIASASVGGVPVPIIIEVVALGLLWLVQEKTIWGRQVSAVGASNEASRLSGVRVEIVRAATFAIVGVGAALSGMLLAAQAQAYYPSSAIGLLLPAYAACFLGSTILRQGTFHVVGTAIGVVFLGALQNGIVQLNYSPAVANVIQGIVLALAVLSSQLGNRLARR